MWFLYDNITAVVIAMTVFLILMSIQMRATRNSTAQTARYAASVQATNVESWLEQDLEGLGRNMGADEWPFVVPNKIHSEQSPTDSITTEFKFYYETTAGDLDSTTYRVNDDNVGEQTVGDTTKTIYELTRSGDDGKATSLTYFDIELLNEDADTLLSPSIPDTVQSFRIRFGVASPFQNEDTMLPEIHRSVVARNHHAAE